MRRSAKHVPTNTILSTFEPEKMGGTTLSMSDYAVLITVSPTVLQDLVHTNTTSPHAVAALGALKSLRQFAAAMLYRPTISLDGESTMRERPTVGDLQRLGEGLMIQLCLLLPFDGEWERASVHRVLELLYRSLPLTQLGSAICELILEKFHERAKREVEQSTNRNSAKYAMQQWREIETLSRALSTPAAHRIPPSWLLGKNGQPLKYVVFHQLSPQKRYTAATLNKWCLGQRCTRFRPQQRSSHNLTHPTRRSSSGGRPGTRSGPSQYAKVPLCQHLAGRRFARDYPAPLQSTAKPYTSSGFKRSGQSMAMYTFPFLLGESQRRSLPSWGSL